MSGPYLSCYQMFVVAPQSMACISIFFILLFWRTFLAWLSYFLLCCLWFALTFTAFIQFFTATLWLWCAFSQQILYITKLCSSKCFLVLKHTKKEVYEYIIVSAPAFISHSTQQGFSSTVEMWSVSPMNVRQIKLPAALICPESDRTHGNIYIFQFITMLKKGKKNILSLSKYAIRR